ncbi:MAG: cysteine desulfurase-like protein [Acidobacteria bacterium]|nr:MAG: cysteine desulfurase-like protein [Acidobacteriota bacterium]
MSELGAGVRHLFPALNRKGSPVFFDNAAGAQVPQQVLDAVNEHLLTRNVQRGAPYRESREVDATIARARQSVAAFLNAADPDEVAFGMNATSFIRLVSLALAQSFGDRREIIVTDLDHEANVATWLALEREGATIRWWKVREDGALHVNDLEPLLSSKTRLVACTVASNAIGTLVDVTAVAKRAHASGAEVFLDAVHYGPHGPFDVQAWGCDYLVCSGYKIFAPHMGFLWGRKSALEKLPTFREDFIPDTPPLKIEVGTFVYENVAGMNAALEYLSGLAGANGGITRERLVAAMLTVRDYEATLSRALLEGARSIAGATIYGMQDLKSLAGRVPTLLFTLAGVAPGRVATTLANKGIAARNGHMYSPRLMQRLGLSPETGAVRVSLVHYNTIDEIGKFVDALDGISKKSR